MEEKIKPPHYKANNGNDVIKFAQDNNLDFLQANIIKYVVRFKDKNGIEDLNKAQEYLNRLITDCETRDLAFSFLAKEELDKFNKETLDNEKRRL